MNQIYKTKGGQHIDLSQIISIDLEIRGNYLKLSFCFKTVSQIIYHEFRPIIDDCDKNVVNHVRHKERVEKEVIDLVNKWIEFKEAKPIDRNFVTPRAPCDICENKDKKIAAETRCHKSFINQNGISMYFKMYCIYSNEF